MMTDFGYSDEERSAAHKHTLQDAQYRCGFELIKSLDPGFAEGALEVARATSNVHDFEESITLFNRLRFEELEAHHFKQVLKRHRMADKSVSSYDFRSTICSTSSSEARRTHR